MQLLECLSLIKEPRRRQGQRFEYHKLLMLIIMGMMRGCYHYREIARFCFYHQSELSRLLDITSKHMPSHATIRQLVLSLDFSSLQACFHTWAKQYVPIEENEWICIDGKSIKSTVSDSHNSYQNFVCLVSLFSQKREQIIFAERFENKEKSEASVEEQLIESLDLKGVIFTMDALHCKKNAASDS
jgi:hypothetical protein